MIRPKLSLRRPLAVVGAMLAGLTAAVAVATPASAHHSVISVKADCDTATGEWVTEWTVNTVAPAGVSKYRFVQADATSYVGETAAPFTIPGIAVTPKGNFPNPSGTPLVGSARLPGDVTKATLVVRAQWNNRFTEDSPKSKTIGLSGECSKIVTPPPAEALPKASVTADCDGSVAVKLENAAEATAEAKFTVEGTDGFSKKVTVAAGESTTVTVPAASADKVTVTAKGQKEPLYDQKPEAATDCVKPGEPTGAYQSTCDKLTFEVANPQDGTTVEVTFTSNKGDVKKLTVAPGETKTVEFDAVKGLTVTPSAEGMDDAEPVAWEQPADCATGGGGPSLPVTGAAAGGIAAGAALLLAAGAVLFVVARRRRIRFTA
ncbi:cell wall anchor protein [Plantactinospora sp. KBS50]|uniref:cell wall anchor protein n=1 Tax=Plantactinospora sp. KBS50 TaxID=2024580 RepID=UPI000BAAE6BA|nr:cell wall anchor protein [Plantactinospora sp. KBS50]ASW53984.1 cell wall anchor protein [Plantactinospora sp. KBS50]